MIVFASIFQQKLYAERAYILGKRMRTISFSKVFLCFLMGKKSTPEYYCSCTPVNFYYVNVSFV